ncbi:MAG: chemotaxis protein CheW [Archangium sp.]|nr:chemotaxis protein CheW [Archangium sp.]
MSDERVDALRRDFDQAFALPITRLADVNERFVTLRVSGMRHAVRVRELSGLSVIRHITTVPRGAPGLLGLVGLRGALVPVYSLAALLNGGAPERVARWLLLHGAGANIIGFAASEFDGYAEIPRATVHRLAASEASRSHVKEVTHAEGHALGVIDLAAVAQVVSQSIGSPPVNKER